MKAHLIDTAYLSEKDWNKFSKLLDTLEQNIGIFREPVCVIYGSRYGDRFNTYELFYKTGVKNRRLIEKEIRNIWGKVKNPLSRRWK